MQGAQGHSSAWREVPGACAFIRRGRFVSFDSLLKIAEKFSVLCSWDTGQLCVPLALGLPQLCPVTLHGGHLPSSVDFGTIPQSAACLPLPQFQGQLTYIFTASLRFKHCSNSCPTANLPPPVPMCDPNPAWWQDPEPGSSSGILTNPCAFCLPDVKFDFCFQDDPQGAAACLPLSMSALCPHNSVVAWMTSDQRHPESLMLKQLLELPC